MRPATPVEVPALTSPQKDCQHTHASVSQRPTHGLRRCAGFNPMMVLTDRAQKHWAESSRGEAHLLPSSSQPTSTISCFCHKDEVVSEVEACRSKNASTTHENDVLQLTMTGFEHLDGESWQAGGRPICSHRTCGRRTSCGSTPDILES